ncbi:MAG TPA: DUF3857 domain-containing protein [Xanthomonadaceae bacterium]|nr:DUF3857 domain-containing protein [Xanthomonadaceae bacterium]
MSAHADERREIEADGYSYQIGPVPSWVDVLEAPDRHTPPAGESVDLRLIDLQSLLNGSQGALHHRMVMGLLTEQGVADNSQIPIEFDPGYQRLVLHHIEVERNGERLDRLRTENITLSRRERQFEVGYFTGAVTMLIVIEDVRVGDVLHYAYTIEGANPIHAEYSGQRFRHYFPRPVARSRIRVVVPDGRQVKLAGDALAEVRRKVRPDGATEIDWRKDGSRPVRVPDDTPGWYEPGPVLEVGLADDWASVVAWGLQLYQAPSEPDGEIGDLARQITEGAGDDEARIVAMLRFVQDEVRYFAVLLGESTHRPSPATEVLKRRFGDCKDKTTLLITLLRAQGFEAWPALVSTTRRRGVLDGLPGSHAFDHVIVLLEWQGRQIWLDPTLNYQRGNLERIGFVDFEAALPLRPGQVEPVRVELPQSALSGLHVDERYEPGENAGEMLLTVHTTAIRHWAEFYRRQFAGSSMDQVAESFVDYYSRLHGGVVSLSGIEVEDDLTENRIVFVERYRLPEFWSAPLGQLRHVDLIASGLIHTVPQLGRTDREAPQLLGIPAELVHRTAVVLPKGWRWRHVPKTLEHVGATMSYRMGVRSGVEDLEIEHRYHNRVTVVDAEDWPRHHQGLRSMREALSFRLVVHDPTPSATTRQDRLRNLIRSGD